MKPIPKIDRYAIQKVKEKRIELGYSQADLSYELDVSAGFVGKVESDKLPDKYSLERLNELARIFNCSIHDFLPKRPI